MILNNGLKAWSSILKTVVIHRNKPVLTDSAMGARIRATEFSLNPMRIMLLI
jgi:hypothetical protein